MGIYYQADLIVSERCLAPGILMSQLPFGLLAQGRGGHDDDDDESQAMGFTQDVH